MYLGALMGTKFRSISDIDVIQHQSSSHKNMLIACEANGKGWQLDDWSNTQMVKDLLILLGRTTNVQAKYGRGADYRSTIDITGKLKSKGEFYGDTRNNQGVKVFWLENWYGNIYQQKQGCVTKGDYIMAKMYPPYNDTGEGYNNVKQKIKDGGYVGKTQITEYGEFPITLDGGTNKYGCDYYADDSTNAYVLWGGASNHTGMSGFFIYLRYSYDYLDSSISGSLAFK